MELYRVRHGSKNAGDPARSEWSSSHWVRDEFEAYAICRQVREAGGEVLEVERLSWPPEPPGIIERLEIGRWAGEHGYEHEH